MERLDQYVTKAFNANKDNPFLISEDKSLTYISCQKVLQKISSKLSENSNKHEGVVILCNDKWSGLQAILSCLINQCPYIPLDTLAPFSRNFKIISENKFKHIIISKEIYESNKNEITGNFHLIDLNDIDAYLLVRDIEVDLMRSDVAFVLFTSGSTGTPKGILISHQNALCFIKWSVALMGNLDKQTFSSIAPFHFDLSVFDIYVSILKGSRLFLFENEDIRNPRYVTQMIDKFHINVTYTTPTVYNLILQFGKLKKRSLSSLTNIIFAGEQMSCLTLDALRHKCPKSKFYNFYGPTETNVCAYFDATKYDTSLSAEVPIGNACPYDKIKIASANDGQEGQLLVSGESVFIGFLNSENQTKSSLIKSQDHIWYQTGDIVIINDYDQYVYVGRADRMVKVKGNRIELQEIEYVLNQMHDIINSGVITKKVDDELKIIAFIESKSEVAIDTENIKNECISQLPYYMIPNSFILVEKLPLNSNSKLDYKTLSSW